MHFMVLILLFLLGAVLWGFVSSNPRGVPRGKLLACNVIVLAAAFAIAAIVGPVLYADAVAVKSDEPGLAAYLAIMASGTAFLIAVAAGGLLRNLVLFPLAKRVLR
jgi:ABC-type transport system involved in cytochrome c biogenesis permease subunit